MEVAGRDAALQLEGRASQGVGVTLKAESRASSSAQPLAEMQVAAMRQKDIKPPPTGIKCALCKQVLLRPPHPHVIWLSVLGKAHVFFMLQRGDGDRGVSKSVSLLMCIRTCTVW